MNNPRGLKLWGSDIKMVDSAEKLIDMGIFNYVEVMPLPESYVSPFTNGLPYIVHSTHEQYGTNLGDKEKHAYTREMLVKAFDWADILHAKLIVVHPGYGDINATLEILDDFIDPRLCIENMPMYSITGKLMLGYTREQMEELLHPRGLKFCLDFGHAMKAAIPLNKDVVWRAHGTDIRSILCKEFIVDMEDRITPSLFHLSDGTYGTAYDDHLSLGKGDFDIGFFKEIIEGNPGVPVTFETTRLPGTFSEDVWNAIQYLEI
jgi:endonuclease IV